MIIPSLFFQVSMCPLATLAVGSPHCGEEVYKYGFSEDQRAEIIASHNAVRTQYGASPLIWDSALAMGARKVTELCKMKHQIQLDSRYPDGVGQNLCIESNPKLVRYSGFQRVIDGWAGESSDYDFVNHQSLNGRTTRDFTQLVWKNTTLVGCDMIHFKESGFYKTLVACNHGPAGNVQGWENEGVGHHV